MGIKITSNITTEPNRIVYAVPPTIKSARGYTMLARVASNLWFVLAFTQSFQHSLAAQSRLLYVFRDLNYYTFLHNISIIVDKIELILDNKL